MTNIEWSLHKTGDTSGHPLMLLHGFLGSGRDWHPLQTQLPGWIHSVAPDLPGHGSTQVDLEELDFDSLAAALAKLARTEFDRPPVLAGYSLGGRVALYTALAFPGYINVTELTVRWRIF